MIRLRFSQDLFGSVLRIDCGVGSWDPLGGSQQRSRRKGMARAWASPGEVATSDQLWVYWKDEATEPFDGLRGEAREEEWIRARVLAGVTGAE